MEGSETASVFEEDVVEPIAILGMSCRFPQDATSPQSFWDMLAEGRCANTAFPEGRISIDGFYNADGNRLNKVSLLPDSSSGRRG